jgi:hypothetical protein
MSGDVIELLIYHQPGVKPSLTLRPFGVLGYVAGHSLTLLVCYHFIYYLTAITYQSYYYYHIWMFVITLLVCYRFCFSCPHFIIVY